MAPLTVPVMPRRTAYLRPATLRDWSLAQFADWAMRVADQGVEGVVTKLPAISDELVQSCDKAGIAVIGSFSCYATQGGDPAPDGPIALDDHGRPLEPVEWYTGLVPGDPRLEDARAATLGRHLRRGVTGTVILDFLRWPGHWETESRAGGVPRPCSFDPDTLGRFLDWAEATGVEASVIDPQQPARSARTLLGPLRAEWQSFRTQTVTQLAARLAGIAHGQGAQVGAFVVPLPDESRRRDYGQDTAALAQHLDLLIPMTYHAITAQPAGWIGRFSRETAASTGKPVVAMIQLTASSSYSGGWDWGAPIDSAELAAATEQLDHDIDAGTLAGYCYFPGEALSFPPARPTHDATTTAKGPLQ